MQERAAETIRRIVDAAGEMFDEEGYAGTTTLDIQRRAKVSRGGFYHHFTGKEPVGHAVLERQRAFFEETSKAVLVLRADELPSGLWLQFLVDTSYAYCHGLLTDPVLRAAVRLSMEPGPYRKLGSYTPQLAAVTAVLDSARRAAELLSAVRPEPTAQTLVGSFTGVQTLSQVITDRQDLEDQVRNMWSVCLPGIARPEVLTRLRLGPAPTDTAPSR
ncbi:ScbR family autoregulator-binding transcription factor [Streptomyces microflavus]|uniref:ScbR family autoregulator-binding transcription factor n=1 Tax=Streptomyces microflavus TaxID=1919 RepID=UPI0037F36761